MTRRPRDYSLLSGLVIAAFIIGILLMYLWNKPLGPQLMLPTRTAGTTGERSPLALPKGPDTASLHDPWQGSSGGAFPDATPRAYAPGEPVCGGPELMTILLIGSDYRGDGYLYGLADAIRIVRIDFTVPSVTVLDFPRDLWVEIPGIADHYGLTHGKLNQAYFYGSEGMGYYDGPGEGPGLLARTLDLAGFTIRNAGRAVFCGGRACKIVGPGTLADSDSGVESSNKVTLVDVTVTGMAEQGVKVLWYLKMYNSRIENSATGARAPLKALLVDSEITGNRLDGIRGFGNDPEGEGPCGGGRRVLLINSTVSGNATGPFDPGDCEFGNATTCADIRTCDRAPRLVPASTCGTSLSVASGTPCSAVTRGKVTWSSTICGERPIHSVKTMTWFSERSGIASSVGGSFTAVTVTVRPLKACLAPLIAVFAGIVDVGDAIPVTVAVGATALPLLHAMAVTMAMALVINGRGCVEFGPGCVVPPGLHVHRYRLHVDPWNLHADREVHIAAGLRR